MHFDEAATRNVSAIWQWLQRIYGTPIRSELGTQPHVTLAVLEDEPGGIAARVESMVADTRAFDLQLGSLDCFEGDEGVVFIAVAATEPLLQLHARVTQMLRQLRIAN